MLKSRYKTLKAAVVVTAGLAIATPMPAIASSAGSSPAEEAAAASAPALVPVAVSPAPKRLKSALLAEKDLPGYQLLFDDNGTSAADINTDVDSCDQRPGTKAGRTETAEISFVKDGFGPLLIENLTVTGPGPARAMIAGLAAAPRKCPTVKLKLFGQAVTMKLTPLRVPRLGDAAAGIAFMVKLPDRKTPEPGKLIAVAYQGVVVNILLTGTHQPGPSEATAIATTAVRKLQHTR